MWSRLEQTPRKSLKRPARDTGVSKSSARRAKQLMKLGPYETPCEAISSEQGSLLQLASAVCRRRYWSSQNPHLTHEVPHYPVKVCVRGAVSARRMVGPVFLSK
jgi:hypothetical protein